MLWEAFKLAILSVRRNVLRSILTLLGIVIGVAAVIAMVTVGDGTTQKVTEDLSKLGSNLLIAQPGRSMFGPGGAGQDNRSFDDRTVVKLRNELTGVRAIAPATTRAATLVYGSLNYATTVTGTDSQFFTAQDWTFAAGRPFSDGEVRSGSAVCVIGKSVSDALFAPDEPLGKKMRIGNVSCDIIGVLDPKGQGAFGNDQDNTVVVPLRTYQRRLAGNTRIPTIYISAATSDDIPAVTANTEQILREIRRIGPGQDDTFTVRDMSQIISTMTSTSTLLTGLLSAVAGVSLLVGGIGIMNIMLVSVTERTREIGIRLAIGALELQVLTQFLVEALVLALMGGVIGIILGLGLAGIAGHFMTIPFVPSLSIITLAFLFSGAIGLGFGFFPARRAARLDPIDALRHE
ncbi:ABC transporter permease [Taklimakanibacter lacteus]|uniref:ABC transporter permease n=1 Tax=Taklimakanibacter lacteus TaxID=2268456 RepID=UPI000E6695FE